MPTHRKPTSSQLIKQQTHHRSPSPTPPPHAGEVLSTQECELEQVLCCLPPVTSERLGLSQEVTSWALPLPKARAARTLLKQSCAVREAGSGQGWPLEAAFPRGFPAQAIHQGSHTSPWRGSEVFRLPPE